LLKRIFLIILFGSFLICCHQKPSAVVKDIEVTNEQTPYWMQFIILELGKIADSTFNDSKDLNSILSFKIIDTKGTVKPVSMEKAIKLYYSNTKNNSPLVYPIFEIKNSSKVILPVFGKGLWDKIWAKVVVDKKTFKVLQIEFDHKGETPGFGANISEPEFKSQFIGSILNLNQASYSLYKNYERLIKGDSKIDAISGATITSMGAIEMLNKGLLKYRVYLH